MRNCDLRKGNLDDGKDLWRGSDSMANGDETLIFGYPIPNARYTVRQAAYVVIVNDDDKVAIVKGGNGRVNAFLPGGGSLSGEAPEDTAIREVREELARDVRLVRKLGDAIQFFYADTEDRHYKMLASFFDAEFMREQNGDSNLSTGGEHELLWLPIREANEACFHACHAWAINRAAGVDNL